MSCEKCEAKDYAMAKLVSENKGLKGTITKILREDKTAPDIERLFGFWRLACGHPRTELDDEYRSVARKALKRHGFEMCHEAIRGVGRYRYVVDGKRSAHGTTKERYDDFELILRNVKNVRKFAQEAIRADYEDGILRPDMVPPTVKAIRERDGEDAVYAVRDPVTGGWLDDVAEWQADCPACGRTFALAVRWGPQGQERLHCVGGCPASGVAACLEQAEAA